jgi:hypothetical protein
MSVKGTSLDNPERGMDLTTRVPQSNVPPVKPTAEEELLALRQRISDALATTPTARIPECVACYRHGWVDALNSLKE